MAITKIKPIKATVKKAIDYIINPFKTDEQLLVSSYGCIPETADIEFEFTREKSRGIGNNLAFHVIQSFAVDDNISPADAHQLGIEFANKILKNQHEYVISTHIDKRHIHNHIIFNSVNYITYNKYHDSKDSYRYMRQASDAICLENGLSVIENKKGVRGKGAWEYQQDKVGNSYKTKLQTAIDEGIQISDNWEDFLKIMIEKGYEIKEGKYISFRAPEQERFTRAKRIGDFYSDEKIKDRIENKELYNDYILNKSTDGEKKIQIPKTRKQKFIADPNKINLISNLQENIKCQENNGYKYRMEVVNLKETSKTLNFLIRNNMKNAAEFLEKYDEIKSTYAKQKNNIVVLEKKMGELSEKIKYVMNYKKYQGDYYKARADSTGKYLKEHEKEIIIFEAAKRFVTLNKIDVRKFDVALKLEDCKVIREERNLQYNKYEKTKTKVKEYDVIKKNVESVLKKQFEKKEDLDIEIKSIR